MELFITAASAARMKRPVSASDRALMVTVESLALRLGGLGDGGVSSARRAASALRQLDLAGKEELGALLGDLHLHVGIGLFYGGLESEAVVSFEAGASAAPPREPALHAWALLAGSAALRGELDAAGSWLDLARARPWPPGAIDDYHGTFLRVAQSLLALEEGDVDEAEGWLDRVWRILPTVEHWSVLLQVRALLDIGRGEPLEGLERTAQVRRSRRSRTGSTETVRRRLDETEALLLLAAGRPAAADRALRSSRSDSASGAVALGRLALAQGRTDLALARLARASTLGLDAPRLRAEHASLEAAALLRLGHSHLAEPAVARLSAQLSVSGLTTPLLLVPGAEGPVLIERLGMRQARRPVVWESTTPSIPEIPSLTRREEVVLRALVETASPAQIAQRLTVSVNTVKSQLRVLYRKLNATNRQEALAAAASFGLLQEPGDDGPENRVDEQR